MPLKPRCALKLAVVGNRRFAGEPDEATTEAARHMKAEAARACAFVWEAVIDALRSALETDVAGHAGKASRDDPPAPASRLKDFFRDEPPQLTILSGLAAGADQIGAETALAIGRAEAGVEVHLDAVLPFRAEHYPGTAEHPRPEFRPDEVRTFESLAAQARQIVRLEGRYGDAASRHRAYRQGRDMLLQHADMLVAIYDPAKAGGAAGTQETVRLALAAAQPVVAILLTEREARIAVYSSAADRRPGEDEALRAHRLDSPAWRAELATQVHVLLALPGQLPAPGETERDRVKRQESLAESVQRLRILFYDVRPHFLCRPPLLGRIFQLFGFSCSGT